MALELEHRRNEVELLAGENEKYKSLVENLNKQIEEFNRLVAQYKKAADERGKALEAFGKIEALYKSTIADQDKRIRRLEATNSLLKKLAPAAAIAGFVLGILVGAK
jgi:DNA repair exonuclease SbcCD ATPase subunit